MICGYAVAVVTARDRYAAVDVLAAIVVEAIVVEDDQLPALVDMQATLADGAPLVHESAGTDRCFLFPRPGPASLPHVGDVVEAHGLAALEHLAQVVLGREPGDRPRRREAARA